MNRKNYTALALVLGVMASVPSSGSMNWQAVLNMVKKGVKGAGHEAGEIATISKAARNGLHSQPLAIMSKEQVLAENIARSMKSMKNQPLAIMSKEQVAAQVAAIKGKATPKNWENFLSASNAKLAQVKELGERGLKVTKEFGEEAGKRFRNDFKQIGQGVKTFSNWSAQHPGYVLAGGTLAVGTGVGAYELGKYASENGTKKALQDTQNQSQE